MPIDPREIVSSPAGKIRQAGTVFETAQLDQLRRRFEGSLYAFAKGVVGFDKFTPALHFGLCQKLQTTRVRRKCILLPRDHFKTSCIRALYIHILIQPQDGNIYRPGELGANTRILHAAESQANARNQLNWVRRQFESNDLLRNLWPHVAWGDRPRDIRWNNDAFVLPRSQDYPEASLECIGVGGAIASRHYDIIGKDDLISKEAANSKLVMQDAIEWDDASYALFNDPERDLEFITGTRWAVFDLYQRKLDREGVDWNDAIAGVDNHKVHFYTRSAIEDGKPIFPELFSMQALKLIERRNPQLFALNYMNQPAGGALTDFDMQYLRQWELRGRDAVILPSDYDQTMKRDDALMAQWAPEPPIAPIEGFGKGKLDSTRFRQLREKKYDVRLT